MHQKQFGLVIAVVSAVLIVMTLFFRAQLEQQQLQACEQVCGQNIGDSCTINTCPYHNAKNLAWIPIFSVILMAGLGGIGLYIALFRKNNVIEEKQYDLTGLDHEGKKVFMLVHNSPDEVYQNKLMEHVGFSKAKMTRILDRLEKKGLVERRRRGMTNIVVLK